VRPPVYSVTSIESLYQDWAAHPLGKNRVFGGRRSLDGFGFQLYFSLDVFFDVVVKGDPSAQFIFDGLSDLARMSGDLIYLTQAKTTIDNHSIRDAIAEAMAVDEFLEEKHPRLRSKFRFRIAGRRIKSLAGEDPGNLDSDWLKVEPARWNQVRNRVLPVEISASPRVSLAIKLWPHTRNSFALVDECAGRLLDGIGANKSSAGIAEMLLEVWNRDKTTEQAPGRMLGVRDLAPVPCTTTRIVHGVAPLPDDLTDGCFKDWPDRLDPILQKIQETATELDELAGRKPLPVFWLVGPSGSGKSVLVLQTIRELVLRGEAEAVNYLGQRAEWVPSSLRHGKRGNDRLVIAVDDLYAPGNRDGNWLRDTFQVLFSTSWARVPWILTCGPKEQLKAFQKQVATEPDIKLVPIQIANLSQDEQLAYHAWYESHTGSSVRFLKESILVAAAWIYELRRKEQLTPEAFAERFDRRLGELGLREAARAAMALNQYQFAAPATLFSGLEAQLDQLQSEDIYRAGAPDVASRRGRFFHPAICRVLYDCLVERTEARRRGEDLARAFGSMLDETGDPAVPFLAWLAQEGTADTLPPRVFHETLAAMWREFETRGPREETVPHLFRWARILVQRNVVVEAAVHRLPGWLDSTSTSSVSWGLLFQIAWDLRKSDHSRLWPQGLAWLRASAEPGGWNFVWQRLWAFDPGGPDLAGLGIEWLEANPAHPGWSYIWQKLLTQSDISPVLLRCALQAVPLQEESSADIPIWQHIEEKLAPTRTELLQAIARKLVRVRSPYSRQKGIEFIMARIGGDAAMITLAPVLAETLDEPAWAYLWLGLAAHLRELEFLGLGRDWLKSREDKPEWSHVWRRLLDEDSEKTDLLPVGRDWLTGREDKPEWSYVWRRLLDEEFEKVILLPVGRDWLKGRKDKPEWSYVWRRLIDEEFEKDSLLPVGRDWLKDREDKPEWNYVWQRLLDEEFEKADLLPVGRDWLKDREDRPEWAYVWRRLLNEGFEKADLLPVGRDWLKGREDKPEWAYVWRRLLDEEFKKADLLPVGRDWLNGRGDKPEWNYVWQRLLDEGFERVGLLPVGRDWLKDREDRPEWAYVWRRLLDEGFEKVDLLPVGRGWLKGREDKSEWSHVWRRLLDEGFEVAGLLPVGRDWLKGREDKPEWNYVWHRLLDEEFEKADLLSVGRDWLNGPRHRNGYQHVFKRIHGHWPRAETRFAGDRTQGL
jgi:hypothetical protein